MNIEKIKQQAAWGDLLAVQELITRLEAAEKAAARWEVLVADAKRDYVEGPLNVEPYWQRFECAAAIEEYADAALKQKGDK